MRKKLPTRMRREAAVLNRPARQGHTQLFARRRICRDRAAGCLLNAICSCVGCGAARLAPMKREGRAGDMQQARIDRLFAQRLTLIKMMAGKLYRRDGNRITA